MRESVWLRRLACGERTVRPYRLFWRCSWVRSRTLGFKCRLSRAAEASMRFNSARDGLHGGLRLDPRRATVARSADYDEESHIPCVLARRR